MSNVDIITNNPERLDLLEEHWDRIVAFFGSKDAHDLYPKPKRTGNNDFYATQCAIEDIYGPVNQYYGKCFPAAKFVVHFGGGKQYFALKCIRSFSFCKEGFSTTHWFAQHKASGKIFDPTVKQFVYPGYEWDSEWMQDRYRAGRNADLGFAWLKKGGPRFDEVAPSKLALKLGCTYKELHGTMGGLDWWNNTDNTTIKERPNDHRFIQ